MGSEQQERPAAFHWGVSTAAYQTEGAWNLDGKGQSIWDVFANTKGKIHNNDTGNTACDFYHRFPQDLTIMSQLGIRNFRFSISWSRILPEGRGQINKHGIDFYNRLIDLCLELDIVPWVTLYHWDLPWALEQRGGWTNREVIHWFTDYISTCLKYFGDRVTNWIILNEPMAFTGAGHFLGVHAPGRKGLRNFLPSVHHAALCQAEGARVVRSFSKEMKIGTTFSTADVQPFQRNERDFQAVSRVDALLNRLFVEPLAGLGYPVKDLKILQRLEPYIKDGDEARLPFNMDFIGIQNYTREKITHAPFIPFIGARIVKPDHRKVETTVMNWEVYPDAIYNILRKFSAYTSLGQLIVTENGAAFTDHVIDGRVIDTARKKYLEQHIAQVLRARNDGVNVNGYFVWSFTDNFEWAEGYRPRFGLIYIDFETQKRIIKHSGQWYSRMIRNSHHSSIASIPC